VAWKGRTSAVKPEATSGVKTSALEFTVPGSRTQSRSAASNIGFCMGGIVLRDADCAKNYGVSMGLARVDRRLCKFFGDGRSIAWRGIVCRVMGGPGAWFRRRPGIKSGRADSILDT
jgi:hypothetical protein